MARAASKTRARKETDPSEIRAALYVRLSVATARSVSVDMQQTDLVREVEHKRWAFDPDTDLFIDEGYSGSKEQVKRPAFERLMEAVAADRYQRIIVWKLDRFSRRPAELHTSLEFMSKHRCHLVSIHDSIDSSTTSGRLLISVAAAVAAIEVENTAVRVLGAQDELTKLGRWGGGPPPYGWHLVAHPDGKGNHLEIVKEQAAVVRKAAKLIVHDNHGIGSAAKWLNARGYLAGRDRPWSPQALGTVLRRRTLVGQHERGGRVTVDGTTGRPSTPHDAILDLRLYTALQARLAELGQHKTKEAGSGTLLAGLVRCGLCGGLLHGCDSERSPKGNYRCRLRYDLNGDCPGVSILARTVEKFVADSVIERLGAGGNIPMTAQEWDAGRLALADAGIEERQRFVRAEMQRLQEERRLGRWNYPDGPDDWDALFQGYVAETNELALRAEQAVARATGPAPAPYFPWKDAEEVLRTWRRLQQQDRRRTIRQVLNTVTVHPVGSERRIAIDWRTDVRHAPE